MQEVATVALAHPVLLPATTVHAKVSRAQHPTEEVLMAAMAEVLAMAATRQREWLKGRWPWQITSMR